VAGGVAAGATRWIYAMSQTFALAASPWLLLFPKKRSVTKLHTHCKPAASTTFSASHPKLSLLPFHRIFFHPYEIPAKASRISRRPRTSFPPLTRQRNSNCNPPYLPPNSSLSSSPSLLPPPSGCWRQSALPWLPLRKRLEVLLLRP
jgi:hypothetical protein